MCCWKQWSKMLKRGIWIHYPSQEIWGGCVFVSSASWTEWRPMLAQQVWAGVWWLNNEWTPMVSSYLLSSNYVLCSRILFWIVLFNSPICPYLLFLITLYDLWDRRLCDQFYVFFTLLVQSSWDRTLKWV